MNRRRTHQIRQSTRIAGWGAITILLQLAAQFVLAQDIQGTRPVTDADSAYVRTFVKSNDIRAFYGGQGNRLVLASLRDGSPDLTRNMKYFTEVSVRTDSP